MDAEWGFCLEEEIVPVLVSDFRADLHDRSDLAFFLRTGSYLKRADADFCVTCFDAAATSSSSDEAAAPAYGVLTERFLPNWRDDRVHAIRLLTGAQLPGTTVVQTAGTSPGRGPRSHARSREPGGTRKMSQQRAAPSYEDGNSV